MLAAEIDHAAVDLAQRHLLQLGMLERLAQHPAVAAADDQRLLRPSMGEQRHMRHHLVIDELVRRGELDDIVEHHHAPEIGVLEDDQPLVLGLAVEKDAVRLQTDTEATVERLFDPAFHRLHFLAAHMLLDHHLARRERLFQDVDGRSRIGLAAHEHIERGITVFRPAMDRDVRLGENRDTRYPTIRREVVKMNVQERRAGDLDTSSERMLDVL